MKPVISLNADASEKEIGSALLRAFDNSVLLDHAPAEEHLFNHESWRQQLGFTTFHEFFVQAEYIFIFRRSDIYEIIPCKKKEDGFRWQREKLLKAPLKSSPDFLGKQVLQALHVAKSENPFIQKYSNPNAGEYPDTLSPKVIEQIQRLGGKMPENPPMGEKILQNFLLPKALEMFADVSWPAKEYRGNRYELWMIEFGLFKEVEELDQMRVVDIEDRSLVHIAFTDGGNYFLVIDLYDPDPSDPKVYKLDHD